MLRHTRNLLLTLTATTILLSTPAFAQSASGTVTGKVTDSAGANMPNVRVELENIDTNQRFTITTDVAGTYTLVNVPPGRYRVITTGGSSTSTPSQEIVVQAIPSNTINISIPSGPGTDTLVHTETETVSMTPASIFDTWNTRWVQYLPKPNFVDRNGEAFGAYNLAVLADATVSSVPGARGGVAVAGQRPDTNLFHVDGIANQNLLTGGPLTYISNEATHEFSLMQNQNSPLFGQTGGPDFNTIVRTGTNKVHGSVYDYLQNRWFNATDRAFAPFGYNENNQPRQDMNRLGASLGLPLIPSKLFFFGNFEYIPLGFDTPVGGFITAPTASGFATLANVRGVSASNLGILQSSLGAGVPSTQTGTITVNGTTIPVGLVNNNQRRWQNQMNGTGALDFDWSEKDQLRFRYVHNEVDRNWTGTSLIGAQTPNWQRSLIASAAHYHTFGKRMTNELRFGYNRLESEQYLVNGIAPSIGIGSGANLGIGPQFSPAGIVNTYHIADNFTFRIRGHQLRAGADFRRYVGFSDNQGYFAGTYNYSSFSRFLLDLPPDVSASRAFGNPRTNLGQYLFFGYLHDTWSVTPKLTLDLGVQYQYAQIPEAFSNQGMNSSFNVPGLISFNNPQVQRWNFAPYVGVAVSPWSNKTVLRGSFGMYYDATSWLPFAVGFAPQIATVAAGNLLSNAPGFLASGALQNPGSNNPAGIASYIQDQRMPYSMQWNAAIQQAISPKTSLEFKYLGNRGVRLPVYSQLNYNGVTATNSLPVYNTAPTIGQLNTLPLTLTALQNQQNAYTLAGFTSPINTIGFNGNSWYNAGVARLSHNFTGGLQIQANYTYSMWEDDSTGTPLDIGMTTRQRTWSMYDKRHQANVAALFEVAPLFKNSWSVVRNVFADFNLSGSYNYSIGGSLTPIAGTNAALASNAFGTSVFPNAGVTDNMDVSAMNPLRNSAGQIVAYQVVNPNAGFITPSAGVYTGVNLGGIRLPDVHNVDVAAVKRFNFVERASIELRGEAYNLFNRSQPGVTGLHSIGGSLMPLGSIPGTIDISNLSSLSLLPSNPRTLQFALKVNF